MRNAFVSLALFAAAFLVYNANGREIGSYDSQPDGNGPDRTRSRVLPLQAPSPAPSISC